MKVALLCPNWTFEGSVYFGCREPHLPLEYGYAKALLERRGHEARIVDAQARGLDEARAREEIIAYAPDMLVVTTAPSYLFWRCAPPELRAPQSMLAALADVPCLKVAIGPHASTTPRAALTKLGVDVAVMGEPEEVLVELADAAPSGLSGIASIAAREGDAIRVNGGPRAARVAELPALVWGPEALALHSHHHHRFDRPAEGPGAEIEASRGCPYHCTFCAKDEFRGGFRKRPFEVVIEELDGLIAGGVRYVYFIDEIFFPDRALLEALAARDVAFGVQLRIDNWSESMLDLLGEAGCVSIEAGVESVTPEGRHLLAKRCKATTADLRDRLIHARRRVPFVQATLLRAGTDDPRLVRAFRDELRSHGVWANDPVPMFPYPGSPDYTRRWGAPDDRAWERAVDDYLARFDRMSDLQAEAPLPLHALELAPPAGTKRA